SPRALLDVREAKAYLDSLSPHRSAGRTQHRGQTWRRKQRYPRLHSAANQRYDRHENPVYGGGAIQIRRLSFRYYQPSRNGSHPSGPPPKINLRKSAQGRQCLSQVETAEINANSSPLQSNGRPRAALIERR